MKTYCEAKLRIHQLECNHKATKIETGGIFKNCVQQTDLDTSENKMIQVTERILYYENRKSFF